MIVAYCALHYGREYLYWSIKSIINLVDRFYVLYTPVGSHGRRTTEQCPDTREQLYRLAELAAKDKLEWVESDQWTNEGQHRMAIMDMASAAKGIICVDADEIWPSSLKRADLESAVFGEWTHSWRWPMVHFWRSFNRCVIDDKSYPVRVIVPRNLNGNYQDRRTDTVPSYLDPICHMGYAQSPAITRYKWLIHGHFGEYRKDIDWYAERFAVNAQRDCHPVNVDYWNPVTVDPWQYLPAFMKHHPYANKELIE